MNRPVNSAMKKALGRFLHENHEDPGSKKFILGVSGGLDSQVLLSSFSHVVREQFSFAIREREIVAVGVNHGLRQEADSELDLAEELAEKCGVRFIRERVVVEKCGEGLQAAARLARYGAFQKVKNSIGWRNATIVTAHHKDDRAETVLIRILRGEGVGSLDVVREFSQNLFRPLVSLTRSDLEFYANQRSLKYANDPSNQDEKYLRVWVRKQLLPMMKEKSPTIVDKLVRLAEDAKNLK